MNYKSYRKEVKTYMKKLEKQLKAEYGCIPDEWEISFKMLADNYQMYFDIFLQKHSSPAQICTGLLCFCFSRIISRLHATFPKP